MRFKGRSQLARLAGSGIVWRVLPRYVPSTGPSARCGSSRFGSHTASPPKLYHYRLIIFVVVLWLGFSWKAFAKSSEEEGRFFYIGDDHLSVEGGKGRLKNLSPRLIALVDYLQDRLTKGKGKIKIISGYRSPDYNESLRKKGRGAGKASMHTEGMAIDFSLQGVPSKKLWRFIREMNCCGAGHYGGEMVHLDTGPPRFWEQTTSKVFTDAADDNKLIYVTTEYDIYAPGEKIDLKFVRITRYPFGFEKNIAIVDETGKKVWKKLTIQNPQECIMVHNREEAQKFTVLIPDDFPLEAEKLKVKINFCSKPDPKMPDVVLSNPLVILPP